MFRIVMLLSTLLLSIPLLAATEFQLKQGETSTEFSYLRAPQPTISFSLDNAKMQGQHSIRKKYSAELAELHVRHQLLLQSVKLQQRGVKIRLSPSNLPLSVTVSGADLTQVANIRNQLAATQQQAYQSYLQRDYLYLLTTPLGESYVIPDHVRIMRENLPVLQPVAASFVSLYGRNNIRKIAMQLAYWLQQIPYQNLSDRRESAGAGFLTPIQMLQANQGDCDSKAVVFATVLRNIFPKLGIAIIYFNDHAVIAAQIPAIDDELTVNLNNASYLVLDPTGPAQLPPGKLNPPYDVQLKSRQFSYRLF